VIEGGCLALVSTRQLQGQEFMILQAVSRNYLYISAVNTQQMQRPDVLVQLGYIWRHVSAINWPSSGQQGITLLTL